MTMATLSAQTVYKKQQGILSIARDKRSISWNPSDASKGVAAVSLNVVNITNLQQTPASSAKVILRVFVKEPGQAESISHDFRFTSTADPRAEANVLRDGISAIMPRAIDPSKPGQPDSGGQSAAMTIAAAISGGKGLAPWEDDERLIADIPTQMEILKENEALNKAFMDAQTSKPDTLSLSQFSKQFWSSRIHLLRAHVLAKSQKKGLFNVFSNIQWNKEDSDEPLRVNLTVEHIRAIFVQYPIMLKIYDELVPKKMKDDAFWSRFFQSQLFSTLKGLKVDRRNAARDVEFDQYLDHPDLTGIAPTYNGLNIPKFIDLEGNEENHSQRKGNRPDIENRQMALEKGPIIRRLNAISEKLMVAVKPSDVDASEPIGIDEHEFEQLRLRDLALEEEHQGIPLSIRDQSQFFSDKKQSSDDIDSARIRALDPSKAIHDISAELDAAFSKAGRVPTIELDFEDEDEEMEDEEDTTVRPHIAGATLASDHIRSLIEAHRSQYVEATTTNSNPKTHGGLPEPIYDRLVLTHATTTEFLHQFWMAFHSGDPTRVNEIASLVESLNNAMNRINAVAADAQSEREAHIKRLEAQAGEIFKKSGKRKKIDKKMIGGGEEVVKQLMGPCIRSLGVAVDTYRRAIEEQTESEMLGSRMEE